MKTWFNICSNSLAACLLGTLRWWNLCARTKHNRLYIVRYMLVNLLFTAAARGL